MSCARAARSFTGRYREFLFHPGTLFTFGSLGLLIMAVVTNPGGLVGRGGDYQARTPFYLAAGLVGSVYIWWSAVQGIRKRDFTADIPHCTAAALFVHQYLAAAVVAVLLLLGGMLENFVAARAGRALDFLAALLSSEVTVRRGGKDQTIPLEQVVVDDILLVRSGERIAVDGQIVSGNASINQAAITGESMPVDKATGDTVFTGILNEVGAIEMCATKVGEDTTLGQIRTMVAEAHSRRRQSNVCSIAGPRSTPRWLWDANISSTVNERLERVVGYHPGRPWSLPASTAACVSSWVSSYSGSRAMPTVTLSSFSFATS